MKTTTKQISEWELEEMKREAVRRYERSKERMLREMDERRWRGEEEYEVEEVAAARYEIAPKEKECSEAARGDGLASIKKALGWVLVMWLIVETWPIWVMVIGMWVGWKVFR